MTIVTVAAGVFAGDLAAVLVCVGALGVTGRQMNKSTVTVAQAQQAADTLASKAGA